MPFQTVSEADYSLFCLFSEFSIDVVREFYSLYGLEGLSSAVDDPRPDNVER
jgi:hypothetical protein